MDDFQYELNALIDIEVAKITNKEQPTSEDFLAYWNYIQSCVDFVGRKLVINYESYENWKTDIKQGESK